ncbi:protein tumorous imaginal discs, mitochondrial-like isoform X3 [Liolophura sinensis]|uniref:protein tumorous imaginal discs, mitochondrial-like isoform X3 n=1 Tax=Liolophura sinensis TaxID=3198878 RepID=UPI003158F037
MASMRRAACGSLNRKSNSVVFLYSGKSKVPSCSVQKVFIRLNSNLVGLLSRRLTFVKDSWIKQGREPCSLFHLSATDKQKDYYSILGVPKNADTKTIKKAYYQLAKKYHPDMNKNDPAAEKKFQEVSEAYEVLSDSSKRQQYDAFGAAGSQAGAGFGGASGFGGARGFEGFHSTIDPEELFRKIFGDRGFNMSGFSEDQDYAESKFGFAPASEIMMDLTFQEAARGVNKEINVNVKDICPKCDGKKAEPGTSSVKCQTCGGTGMETVSTGPFVMRTTCRQCKGARVIIKTPCTECQGKGKLIMRKKVVVPVPAGVEDGQTVRMPVGRQEIFITFRVSKSNFFRREGADVHSDVTISLSQAVLGGTTRIPGIYDDILFTIPAGTQSHDRLRLAGKGISRVNSYGYGDHYVHIKIRIPMKLTPQQKALILSYAELETDVNGTVSGITKTKDGKQVTSDQDGLVARIRHVVQGIDDDDPESIVDRNK